MKRDLRAALISGLAVLLGCLWVAPTPAIVLPPDVVPVRISERWRWVQQHCQPDISAPQCATLPTPAGR